jgi:hypothetical protein
VIEGGSVSLPAGALADNLDRLHLYRRSREALASVGIETIGQLAGPGYLLPEAWDALGREGGKEASAVLRALAEHTTGASVDWLSFWRARGITVVPSVSPAADDVPSLIAALPQLVRAAFVDEAWKGTDPERDWIIIDARNGLVSAAKTLEELGYGALGVSRARVQQIEAKAMDRLRRAIGESFHGTSYRVHPDLDGALERIVRAVPAAGSGTVEDVLGTELGVDLGRNGPSGRRLAFLLRLAGAERIGPDGERRPAVWIRKGDGATKACIGVADKIGRLLTETTSDSLTETDIVVELNRGHRSNLLTIVNVRAAMRFCRVAERLEDDRWRGRFEELIRRGDQAYRVIEVAGRPTDLDLVAREINARTRGRAVNVRNLANQLSEDPRFVPVGKSGEWGLKGEHDADAAPIVTMMAEALRRAGHPLLATEIQAAVEARRPVGKNSVQMYLDMRPEFTRLPDRTWALSEWPEAVSAVAAKPPKKPRVRREPTQADRMEAIVVPFLLAAPGHVRPLAEVVPYVAESMGIIRNTVYEYLKRIPAVERVNLDGRPMVRLVGPAAAVQGPGQSALRKLAQTGETPRVEFKSTLRWNVVIGADDPTLQKMCTKTTAAFSNTNGGTLLIGVAPDGSPCGIELDCAVLQKKVDTCIDAFSQSLAAIVSQHLGGAVAAQIVTHYEELDGKTVCVVEVPPGAKPVYLRDGKTIEFYVRNGTTSRALDLPEVAPYIAGRFA